MKATLHLYRKCITVDIGLKAQNNNNRLIRPNWAGQWWAYKPIKSFTEVTCVTVVPA